MEVSSISDNRLNDFVEPRPWPARPTEIRRKMNQFWTILDDSSFVCSFYPNPVQGVWALPSCFYREACNLITSSPWPASHRITTDVWVSTSCFCLQIKDEEAKPPQAKNAKIRFPYLRSPLLRRLLPRPLSTQGYLDQGFHTCGSNMEVKVSLSKVTSNSQVEIKDT